MIEGYYVPKDIREAVELRVSLGEGAWFLGGGTELNSLDAPQVEREHLISIEGLGLNRFETADGVLVIGAGCTIQEMVEADDVPEIVKKACLQVENRSIRNQATIGGHIAAGHPYASVLPILVALEAEVDVVASDGTPNSDPIGDHIGGSRKALITAVRIPVLPADLGAAVNQHSRSAIDLAMLSVAAAFRRTGDVVNDPRIVVGGLAAQPRRLFDVEQQLAGRALPEQGEIEKLVVSLVQADADLRATAEFKRYMVGALVARALVEVAS